MAEFQVHIGFELPFWLALPEGSYEVSWLDAKQTLTVNNSVDRLEVGDFYLGRKAKGVVWCHQGEGEDTRRKLRDENPDMPVTRHALKTVVTHVRRFEASDLDELRMVYGGERRKWVEDTLEIVNRFIDAYCVAALSDKDRGEAGRVALWDVGLVMVSFCDETGSQQLEGYMERVRGATPPPEPFDADRQQIFQGAIATDDEYPLPRLLSISAWSHIQRGNYRAAIVDDFNAIELAVAGLARDLAVSRGLSPEGIEDLLRRLRFEGICTVLLPLVEGPNLKEWEKWPLVDKAQKIRNRVVHRGSHASRSDAAGVHNAAVWTLTWLIGWQVVNQPAAGAR